MQNNKIQVSIITVNYKVEKELIDCISSIVKSKPKVSYEIIIVNNGEKNNLKRILKEEFPQVKYIKSLENIGFGSGNNLGARYASGDFLFFLNPDTTITKDSIDILYNFIINNSNAGMVASLLLDPSGKVYSYQGSDQYNLISGITTSSFINKIFPNNPISRKFFHKNWNKKDIEEFDVVPGTAFIIKKSIFEKAGMFDEKLFLYFEEYDLAKRVRKLGYKNYIIPQAKITHIWEASTRKRNDVNKIFSQSRYIFFKKHYGAFFASVINIVSNIGRYELMLGLILALSAFLGFFRIGELMTFIGDQGWFYLSARDMLITGNMPLVGIASSHPWLHQGALWTYILAFTLWIFNFNPVSGAYATIIMGTFSTVAMYLVGSAIFSKRVGIISALVFATSPLAVFYMRMPYHTSPIPIFVIGLIFSLHKIIQNKLIYLPLSIFLLSILYSFEIATVVLWTVLIGTLGYKLFRGQIRIKEILNKKILTLSVAALATPLLPMILYDVRNGFPQTLKFIAWVFYKTVSFFGYNQQHEFSMDKITIMFNFLFDNFRKLVFAQNRLISQIFLICIIAWVICFIFQKKDKNGSYNLILLLFFVPLLIIILNQTPSDAYLPILFPTIVLISSLFLDFIMRIKRMRILTLLFIITVVFSNISFMFKNDFAFDKSNRMLTLNKRLQAAHEILNIAGDKDYNLKGIGSGSEHRSFTMNYEYLTWWLGHAPSKKNKDLKIYVSESANGIKIEMIDK